MPTGIARVGDHTNQDGGDRRVDPRDIVPAVRRCYSGAQLVAVKGDWTKAPGHDWEKLNAPVAARTFLNGLPVARIGTVDTGGHTVIEGATRTRLGF